MAKAELGLKRSCLSCGMRYYDFNRTPIICPGCQTEFDPELVVRSRRGRAAVKSDSKAGKAAAAEMVDDVTSNDDDESQIDDETSVDEKSDDDVGFDDDDIDVSDDDSAGLIDDDLDEDDGIISGIPKDDE